LNAGNVARLGADVIHAVSNPLDQITAAIHVYGGDFFAIQRSEWDPVTQKEQPYDVQDTIRAFEAANGRIRDAQNH
jgi:predicted metal-dependent enzyme (double-stranded beta helix superfamily)